MRIFFGVRPRSIAVFEIEAEVFDRLALELVDDAGADRFREPGIIRRQLDHLRERLRRRRMRVEGVDRLLSGASRRIGRELVARTDEGVDRLSARRIAGIQPGKFLIRSFKHFVQDLKTLRP